MSKIVNGAWQESVNLGPAVNTAADDASPFIYYDNKTLIFASKAGLAWADMTFIRSQDWSLPSNLGYPINDMLDQVGYSLSYDGWVYFSSSLSNGRLVLKRFRIPESIIQPIEPRFSIVELGLDSLSTKQIRFFHRGEMVLEYQLNSKYQMDIDKIEQFDQITIKASGYEPKWFT